MPRILVMTSQPRHDDTPVLLDEWVAPVHLSDGHAADQLVERLGWALADAEEREELPDRGSERPAMRQPGENGGPTSFSPGPGAAKLCP